MLKTIFRPLAIAIVCLVNVVTLTLGPRVPPQFWSVVALCIVAEVILLGGALAFVDRMTERKAPEPDADEDTGSPYRSQVQSGSGNVQAGGDISNVDVAGDVSIRLDDYLVETDSLCGVGLQANGGELALTHNGQRFVIRYDPRS